MKNLFLFFLLCYFVTRPCQSKALAIKFTPRLTCQRAPVSARTCPFPPGTPSILTGHMPTEEFRRVSSVCPRSTGMKADARPPALPSCIISRTNKESGHHCQRDSANNRLQMSYSCTSQKETVPPVPRKPSSRSSQKRDLEQPRSARVLEKEGVKIITK